MPRRCAALIYCRIHYRAMLICLVVALTGCAANATDSAHSLGARKMILPYVEASQVPMATGGIWISDHEVAFNVRKPGVMQLSQSERNEIQEGNDPEYYRYDHTRWSEVWILDTGTGKTSKYMDGGLDRFKDDVITVVLQSYKPRHPPPGVWRPELGYSVIMEGRRGEEKRLTRPGSPIKFHPKKCPGEPDGSKTLVRFQLKPEHGCLDIRFLEPPELPALYYRSDGKVVELKMHRADIGNVPTNVTNWVDWLGAYLLKNSTIQRFGATQTVHLMKPDGSLLVVPVNVWSVVGIRPTRAGAVGSYSPFNPPNDGLYLWRGEKMFQIAESFIGPPEDISYSLDGCKVSYRSFPLRLGDIKRDEDYRLRVIDLCKAFNLSSDAIPFVWPETSNHK